MVVYQLWDEKFYTVASVKMIHGLGASMRNAREYFKGKGYKGKFVLFNTENGKYSNIRL